MRILKPDTEAEVVEAVANAFASRTPLALEGNASKRMLGRPVKADAVLKQLDALDGK